MPDVPALPLLDAAVRGAAIALLLLTAIALPRLPMPATAILPARLLSLGMAVQLVGNLPWLMQSWSLGAQAPLIAVSVGNGALFWLTVRALFDDAFRPSARDGLPWLIAASASLAACLLAPSPWPSAWSVAAALQRAAPLVFALLAIGAAVRQWDADLVEARRRLRAFLAVSGIAYTLTMLVVRSVGGPRLDTVSALGDALAVLAMVAPVMVWSILRSMPPAGDDGPAGLARAVAGPSDLAGAAASHARGGAMAQPARPSADVLPVTDATPARPTPPAARDDADPADDRLADALARAMDQEQAWRDEGLTIGRLADRLGAPEYRLRRVINRRLGHRNFNAFVNGYRLQAACRALADPARRDEPVLSIALDAGFQSIGPFNRAFRAAVGQTPTEYRRARLG